MAVSVKQVVVLHNVLDNYTIPIPGVFVYTKIVFALKMFNILPSYIIINNLIADHISAFGLMLRGEN